MLALTLELAKNLLSYIVVTGELLGSLSHGSHSPRKEGLVKLNKKFSIRNFDWMMFTGYASVMPRCETRVSTELAGALLTLLFAWNAAQK